jgi:hypothetical protein
VFHTRLLGLSLRATRSGPVRMTPSRSAAWVTVETVVNAARLGNDASLYDLNSCAVQVHPRPAAYAEWAPGSELLAPSGLGALRSPWPGKPVKGKRRRYSWLGGFLRQQLRKNPDCLNPRGMPFSGMPREIQSEYKGVRVTVSESDEAGYYRFWFQIGYQTFHGKTQTKLAGIAVKRAHRVINRKLKEVEPPP